MLELAFLLEIIGPGQTEAAGRRTRALNMAYSMQRDRAAFRETIRATIFRVRRGFGRVTLRLQIHHSVILNYSNF